MRTARVLAAFAALVTLGAAPVHAQIFRAYLALDGNDANPCTLQLPCRLLPAALNAVQSGGEIWMLDSANFNAGPVTVNKSVTILAIPGALGSVVALGGNALNITTTGGVTLRNLNILPFPGNSAMTGVSRLTAGSLTIQDCNIFGFSGSGGVGVRLEDAVNATITRTVFRDNENGITATSGPTVGVSDSLFANHANTAVWASATVMSSTTRMSITRSVARNNPSNAFVADSLATGSVARLDVSESRIEHDGTGSEPWGVAIFAPAGAGTAIGTVSNTVISGTVVAIVANGSANAKAFLSGNTITDNNFGVQNNDGAVVESAGNNAFRNNGTNVSPGPLTNVGTL